MKKYVIGAALILCAVCCIVFVAAGFVKRTDVIIDDFDVLGDEMMLDVHVSSSMGYIRSVKCTKDGNTLKLTFYSAFGGLNSSFMAKDSFKVKIDGNIDRIDVFRGSGYEVEMIKKDGQWQKY